MTTMIKGQINEPEYLNWFVSQNGALVDVFEVKYRIFDVSDGAPGVQVFPEAPGEYEDVTNGPGHFAVGSYYAYDNANSRGWLVPEGGSVGTFRIEWAWRHNEVSPLQSGHEDFEVLPSGSTNGARTNTYIGVHDIRALGIAEEMIPDKDVLASIEVWQAFLERACRQWFAPRSLILEVDGTDSDTIHLGVPIISVSELRINGSKTALDPALYRVYNSKSHPDDRRNPRVRLVSSDALDIYTAPTYRGLRFRRGTRNQYMAGVFGFVEEDGSTPALIKRALTKLVVEKLCKPLFTGPGVVDLSPYLPPVYGAILEERTDGHQLKYAPPGGEIGGRAGGSHKPGLSGVTIDQEILDIVKLYKGPVGIGSPSHRSIN